MKYAILSIGGKQYHAQEGDTLLIEKTDAAVNSKITFSEIVLLRDGERVDVGQPFVSGASVVGIVNDQVKGKKLRVSKFRAKVRYRKSIGFRPQYTKVTVEKIAVSGASKKKA